MFCYIQRQSLEYRSIFCIRYKYGVLECYRKFKRSLCNKFNRAMKVVRSDNGKAYVIIAHIQGIASRDTKHPHLIRARAEFAASRAGQRNHSGECSHNDLREKCPINALG